MLKRNVWFVATLHVDISKLWINSYSRVIHVCTTYKIRCVNKTRNCRRNRHVHRKLFKSARVYVYIFPLLDEIRFVQHVVSKIWRDSDAPLKGVSRLQSQISARFLWDDSVHGVRVPGWDSTYLYVQRWSCDVFVFDQFRFKVW